MSKHNTSIDRYEILTIPRLFFAFGGILSAFVFMFYFIYTKGVMLIIPIESGTVVLKEQKEFVVKPDSGGEYTTVSASSLEDYVKLNVGDRVCFQGAFPRLLRNTISCK
jgi:hypothetical protein